MLCTDLLKGLKQKERGLPCTRLAPYLPLTDARHAMTSVGCFYPRLRECNPPGQRCIEARAYFSGRIQDRHVIDVAYSSAAQVIDVQSMARRSLCMACAAFVKAAKNGVSVPRLSGHGKRPNYLPIRVDRCRLSRRPSRS